MKAAVVAMALIVSALAVTLVLADQASAQLPAGCEEYEICIGPTDEGDLDGGEDPIGFPGADGDGNGSGDSDGSLPFTGYPLTGLILMLLILLVTGLAIRSYIAVRARLGSDRAAH